MKHLILALLLIVSVSGYGQWLIKPGNASIEYKRIANEETKMTWYLLQDTTKIEIGTVVNSITADSVHVTLVSKVKMRQSPVAWIDTTIAERNTLKPVYHASYNGQRDMNLHFNALITGSYEDKLIGRQLSISDSAETTFFDRSFYPTLLRWLPLRTGFTKDLAIYDYNPSGKTGIMKASIITVRQCDYQADSDAIRKVWMVIVRDDIGSGTTTYFIDVESRKLWKMIIASGERKLLLEAA